ncbi:hypothetical protein U1Q18_001041 [Sarracenia purpurea var. burkii]
MTHSELVIAIKAKALSSSLLHFLPHQALHRKRWNGFCWRRKVQLWLVELRWSRDPWLAKELVILHACKTDGFLQGFWLEHSNTLRYFGLETSHESFH